MLSLALLTTAVACSLTAPKPNEVQPAAIPAPSAFGLSLEQEAHILSLEDRREYDAALATEWARSGNPLQRARMALALGRIGTQTFLDANGNGQRDPGELQAGTGDLIGMAADGDAAVRTNVAFALGEIGDPAGAEALFALARDANATVGAEAAEALSKLAKSIDVTRYVGLSMTGPDGVRVRATRFLFRFDTDQASIAAMAALESPATLMRQAGAYALSRRPYAPARDRLELMLADADELTRAYAVAALGRIASPESMPAIVRALGDQHPWVRTNALVAAARVAAKSPAAVQAIGTGRLLALTEDPDPGTRASSIDVLGYAAQSAPAAAARLQDIAANGSRWERELAVGALARRFGDGDAPGLPPAPTEWELVRIVEASAHLPKNGPALRRAHANDASVLVRENVIASIPDGSLDSELDLVRAALEDADPIVRANAVERYAAAKSEPVDAKVAVLAAAEQRGRGDTLNDARLAAITALGAIEYPGRETFLRSLLADGDPVVRRVAADLIEEKLKKGRPQFTPLPVRHTPEEYAAIVAWSRLPHTATIHMTRGDVELALLGQEAPMTAWNFAQLAQRKYFDHSSFMRVVPNFVVQGGDPRNDQNGGPGYAIRDEINLQKYTRGAVGMALSGPDTGGSQFFITHSPQPHLDGGYTIFARVTGGMNAVVDQTERGDRVETITVR